MTWDPAQYLRFGDQRLRPAIDLLNRIDMDHPREVYDLGAGAGNVTRLLLARWPDARITGVDDSAEMLDRAVAAVPGVTWQQADLAAWQPENPADVIFSNAALHWVGGHDRVLKALVSHLAPGGVLAVQMPRNFSAQSHVSIGVAARSGPWRATLEPLLRPDPVAEPSHYFDLLAPQVSRLDLWETEYFQVLEGESPVKEWTKGTWLMPLLAALSEPQRSEFEACYAELVGKAYPRRPDGRTLFPFRRLFMVAKAAAN
jgi:trans-aconitate 2-methyltransferase